MNRLRVFSLILFAVALMALGAYQFRQRVGKDSNSPLIYVPQSQLSVSVKDGENALLSGMKATDATDGDVTKTLVVENVSNFFEKGKRIVNYAAFDSDMNVSKASRILVYSDYESPHFVLNEPLHFRINTSDIMSGIEAYDVLDGNISRKVKLIPGEDFDSNIAGSYDAELEVSNSAGDIARLPVKFEFYDTNESGPALSLSQYLVYTDIGQRIDPRDYLKSVYLDGTRYYFPNAGVNDAERDAQAKADEEEYGTYAADAPAAAGRDAETAGGAETGEGAEQPDAEALAAEALALEAEQRLSSHGGEIGYDRVKIQEAVNYQERGVYRVYYSMTDKYGNEGTVQLFVAVGMD